MEIRVDWISASFTCIHARGVYDLWPVQQMFYRVFDECSVGTLFDFPVDFARCKGWYGYACGMTYQGISVYFYGQDSMGVLVNISGEGCSWLMEHDVDLGVLLRVFRKHGANITRLDVALDLFSEELSLYDVCDAVDVNNMNTRWRCIKVIRGYGNNDGLDIQFGSRFSDHMLRMYDKAKERKLDGVYWVRLESQYRHEVAMSIVDSALDLSDNNKCDFWVCLESVFIDLLCSTLNFVDRSVSSTITRCPNLSWWDEFLSKLVDKSQFNDVILPRKVREPVLLDRFVELFSSQCGQRVATYIKCFGLDALAQYAAVSEIYRSDYKNLIVECEKKRKEAVIV